MKKTFIICFTLLSCLTFSQEPRGYYVIAGGNIPQFTSNALEGKTKISPIYGLGFGFGYNESYNFQLEVLQHSKIIELKTNDTFFGDINSKYEFGGTELGFYFNYFIIKPDEDKIYLSAQIGPQLIFGSPTTKGEISSENFENSVLNANDISGSSKFNYGAGFGICTAYKRFKLNLRYNLGISNSFRSIEKQESQGSINTYSGFESKISSVSMTLAFRFFEERK